jgi:hypothetical protein
MDRGSSHGRQYRLIVSGELGEPFSFLFEGMQMSRRAGTTVLTGSVSDQAHLHGLIERTQELGLVLLFVEAVDEGDNNDAVTNES